MDWFLMENGERVGPPSTDQMLASVTSGRLTERDLVWRAGFSEWLRAGDVEGLFKPPPQPSAPTDSVQGQRTNPSNPSESGHDQARESTAGVKGALWQYKYGRNSSRESSPVQLGELVAMAK